MTVRSDNSGLIDLEALMREADVRGYVEPNETRSRRASNAAPPAASEVGAATAACNPLASVPNEVYLLLSRDPLAGTSEPPAPSPRAPHDSFDAVTTEATSEATTTPPEQAASPPRSRLRLAIASGLGVMLGAGVAISMLAGTAPIRTAPAATIVEKPAAQEEPRAAAAPTMISFVRDLAPASSPTAKDEHIKVPATAPLQARAPATGAVVPTKTADVPSFVVVAAEPAPTPSSAPTTEQASEPALALADPPAPPPTGAPPKPEAEPAPPAAVSLDDAMRGAVEQRDKGRTDTSTGTAGPNRPSLGAVTATLRGVLPAARACLQPNDAARNSLLVFGSDGTVTRVQLMGSKPEDDCIRAALAKAKLPPFLEPSFTTQVVVRP